MVTVPFLGHRVRASTKMYAYIDTLVHGGSSEWREPDEELVIGSAIPGSRLHIRIYDGGPLCTCSPTPLGRWSIAAIHREHYVFPWWHVVHGWEGPQEFLHRMLVNQGFVGKVGTSVASPHVGLYQGHVFETLSYIELLP